MAGRAKRGATRPGDSTTISDSYLEDYIALEELRLDQLFSKNKTIIL
jgi:hypothetical protein